MASPADRFGNWLGDMGNRFSEKTGSWAATFVAAGIEKFFDILGKKSSKQLAPLLAKLEETGEIPAELQPIIDELKNPTGEISAVLGSSAGAAAIGGLLDRLAGPLLLPLVRRINQTMPMVKIGPDVVLQYGLRHPDFITEEAERMHQWGYDDMEIALMRSLLHPILPTDVVGPAWLRDPGKFGKFWDYTKGLGVTDEQMELLKEMTWRVPGVQDVIRYAVKEAYNEEIVREFGQDQEYPTVAEEDARKAGVRPDQLKKEWRAHWNLPSADQGFRLLHRGKLTDAQVKLLLKSLDVMPFWRDKLIELSWDVPNRVELRMMARYGLVDKPFLMDALKNSGLREDYREIVADMMLAQGLLQDLSAQYSKKWLTSDEVKAELGKVGLSDDVKERMFRWITANAGADRIAKEKDLTAAEIIKGVKLGVVSQLDGIDQLMALGYDEAEATYKLAIEIPQEAETLTDEQKIQIDTTRRQRRDRLISRDQEITALVQIGISAALAQAYANNDDLRLVKEAVSVERKEELKALLEAQKTAIDTIRLRRRNRLIDRATELQQLIELGVVDIVAQVYVDNDDLRLAAEKVVVVKPVIDTAAIERQKVAVDTIRLRRRNRLIEGSQEFQDLVAAGVDAALAQAYVDNDDVRLERADAVQKIVNEMSAFTETQRNEVELVRQRRLEGITLHATEVKELTALGISALLAESIAADDDQALA